MYTLMIWTVIAMVGDHHGVGKVVYDWRPIAQFKTPALCQEAAASLGLKDQYRCVRNK